MPKKKKRQGKVEEDLFGDRDSDKFHREEASILELKMRKSRAKAAFTRACNRFNDELDEQIDKSYAKELLDNVECKMDEATEAINDLCILQKEMNNTTGMMETLKEIDVIEERYSSAHLSYSEIFGRKSSASVNKGTAIANSENRIESDLWKQLQRVSIPVFDGNKYKYASWKAAFSACVDQAPCTAEYKLLQLRQYLSGDALKCIDNLGHSATAYEAAKDRLDRKFGGEARQVSLFIEELDNFVPFREENCKTLEKFADLLDIAVINLKELEKNSDLGAGALYMRLKKKMPEAMLCRYHRWSYEHEKVESVEILREWVIMEANFHTRANEAIHGLAGQKKDRRPERSFYSKEGEKEKQRRCQLCSGNHGLWKCSNFKQSSVADRWHIAKNHKLCFRCLSGEHIGKNCPRKWKCRENGCTKSHHTLLHSNQPEQQASSLFVNEANSYSSVQHKHKIALRTIPVILQSESKVIKVNALMDDGSTKTYINEDVARQLNVSGPTENVIVTTLNGKSETFNTSNVKFVIKSVDGDTEMEMTASTTRQVTGSLKPVDWNIKARQWPHLKGLTFPSIGNKPKIDLLIGLDYAELHRSMGELLGDKDTPTARLTPLGWTRVGPVEPVGKDNDSTLFTFHSGTMLKETEDVSETLRKFWEVESVPDIGHKKSLDNDSLIKDIANYDSENRQYTVSVPWKDNKKELVNNHEMALRRLESTERKLSKDPELKSTYGKIIDTYEKKGYISNVTKEDRNEQEKWYLPHFPVVRMDKETTKVRMVFDASAKYKGISLNDAILQGPKLQNELFNILLRFRRQRVAIICDIEEMYLQVGLLKADRQYHRFLWRQNCELEPQVFEFNRVVFGVNASPFLAQHVSQENARAFQNQYPQASESVIKSTYMDDTMESVESEEVGISLYNELCALWSLAGMRPRKWMSNSAEVLSRIPQSERAFQIDINKDELPCMKTLGMVWVSEPDNFTYHHTQPKLDMKLTKRTVLKTIASVFDPLGLVVPFTVRAKIIMQKLWLEGVDWDDELPEHLKNEIRQCFSELEDLHLIQVPRCLNVNKDSQIHTFVDASSDAYGAVVYHKSIFGTNIVASKGRVAPLKSFSIPRLELMAAVIGLTLTLTVCDALGIDLKSVTYWSDSMNVLYWIHSQSRQYKPFVANRIGTIHQHSTPNQWRHVPTKLNPADLASRGESVSNLEKSKLWWQGPDFLQYPSELWPEMKIKMDESASLEMKRKSMTETFVSIDSLDEDFRLNPKKFSDFNHLVKISAWVYRFLDNCQAKKAERRLSARLSIHEIKQAENRLFITAQSESFCEEYRDLKSGKSISARSKLAALNPKLDDESVMRSDSRLKFAKFISYDCRFPIVLPRKHFLTKLIVKMYHEKTNHGGTNSTLAELSNRFWIISAREEIRDWENSCAKCKLDKAKASKQIMGTLPNERLDDSVKAFNNTAVDFAGPFITKQGRGKSRLKRYLCVFTCMTTRAVHLEVAYSLDTNSFMNTFSRFVDRRGVPKTVVSDNGTNFVGCVRELKELYKGLDQKKIVDNATIQRINWKFNPPSAPHFGGVHESMVKCAKRALYKIFGNAEITDEELVTAVTKAESLINSRPLTYQSSNPKDDTVLTPNHFLIGQMGGHFAPAMSDTNQNDLRSRWRRIQELVRHFWCRWMKEYLPTLGTRSKWHKHHRDFKVNDIVLIVDPDTPRGQWPLARVTKVYKGADGHIRVVDLKTAYSNYQRPISRLSLIVESDG